MVELRAARRGPAPSVRPSLRRAIRRVGRIEKARRGRRPSSRATAPSIAHSTVAAASDARCTVAMNHRPPLRAAASTTGSGSPPSVRTSSGIRSASSSISIAPEVPTVPASCPMSSAWSLSSPGASASTSSLARRRPRGAPPRGSTMERSPSPTTGRPASPPTAIASGPASGRAGDQSPEPGPHARSRARRRRSKRTIEGRRHVDDDASLVGRQRRPRAPRERRELRDRSPDGRSGRRAELWSQHELRGLAGRSRARRPLGRFAREGGAFEAEVRRRPVRPQRVRRGRVGRRRVRRRAPADPQPAGDRASDGAADSLAGRVAFRQGRRELDLLRPRHPAVGGLEARARRRPPERPAARDDRRAALADVLAHAQVAREGSSSRPITAPPASIHPPSTPGRRSSKPSSHVPHRSARRTSGGKHAGNPEREVPRLRGPPVTVKRVVDEIATHKGPRRGRCARRPARRAELRRRPLREGAPRSSLARGAARTSAGSTLARTPVRRGRRLPGAVRSHPGRPALRSPTPHDLARRVEAAQLHHA